MHLIGFSLGARAALEIAARLGSSVERIDLISPAGPLDDNTHIDQMAGRAVFKAASSYPRLFRGITAVQAWTARHRPALLYRALFGRTGEASIDVCDFRARSIDLLQASFADGSAGYEREVLAYVGPWSDLPRQVMASTHIWQGTTDNWAPPEMARHLQTLLPRAALQMIEGQSHYGTLRHVLDQLDIK